MAARQLIEVSLAPPKIIDHKKGALSNAANNDGKKIRRENSRGEACPIKPIILLGPQKLSLCFRDNAKRQTSIPSQTSSAISDTWPRSEGLSIGTQGIMLMTATISGQMPLSKSPSRRGSR